MNHKTKQILKKHFFKSKIGIELYKKIGTIIRKRRASLSDKEYVIKVFKENNGIILDLNTPKTFNEKLLWLSIYDRDPLKTQCADKFGVRQYVEEKGYSEILNELYGVYKTVDDIDYSKLPNLFFMKTNHDSGTYALVNKKDPTSIKKAEQTIKKALDKNYYYESREWQYKNIEPLVICEKYIETNDKIGLVDYRFFCFNGKVGFVAVDVGTTNSSGKHAYDAKRNLYNRDFVLLDAKLKREPFNQELITKPQKYYKMVEIAEKLSEPFKHVRVDLYNVNGEIIFGEMTFCNGGGMQVLSPQEFNLKIGELIDIPVSLSK